MVVEEVLNDTGVLGNLVVSVGQIGLWLQTLGVIVIFWIIVQSWSLWMNRKRRKTLYRIKDKLDDLEKKIDKIDKKLKK